MNPTPEQLDFILKYLSQNGLSKFNDVQEKLNLSLEVMATSCIILKYDEYIHTIHPEGMPNPFIIGLEQKGLTFLTLKGGYTEVKRKDLLADNVSRGTIKTQLFTWINIGITLLISLILLTIQLRTCKRNEYRDLQELQKAKKDSTLSAQKLVHDSLYQQEILRAINNPHYAAKNDTMK